jgi:hypothetical protein
MASGTALLRSVTRFGEPDTARRLQDRQADQLA